MVATYPNDAVVDQNVYSVVGSLIYTNTGAVSEFTLPVPVSRVADALVIADGILQSGLSYFLSNNGASVSFYQPPAASNLTLKTLSVPNFLTINREVTGISGIVYSNSSVVSNNGNNYIIDGVIETWALPQNSIPSNKDDILLAISGVLQNSNAFVWPSAVLGDVGLDLTPPVEGSANNYIDIRVLTSSISVSICDRITTMQDRKPDKGYRKSIKFDASTFTSQSGHEKRRLVSRRSKREIDIKYTNISGVEKQAIENFYIARSGHYEAFRFDLSHVNESGIITVKFDDKGLDVQNNHNFGQNSHDRFYTVSFGLKEVFD